MGPIILYLVSPLMNKEVQLVHVRYTKINFYKKEFLSFLMNEVMGDLTFLDYGAFPASK